MWNCGFITISFKNISFVFLWVKGQQLKLLKNLKQISDEQQNVNVYCHVLGIISASSVLNLWPMPQSFEFGNGTLIISKLCDLLYKMMAVQVPPKYRQFFTFWSVLTRLITQNSRLKEMGLAVSPASSEYCEKNPSKCYGMK